ncbi:hypothetical protein DEO72_LG2g3185 [Vigna unguiculata]|uniref:Uncharacterized protein n=1 Tax=Vigna unguiculata TaxID=3917 RepID=A0A4D6L316_VIGUN|nr:hypothetical protein DEO72_LG2g3185 [Vigna unguiculata]
MAAAAGATASSSDHHTSRILHHLPHASNHLRCNEQQPSSTFEHIHELARVSSSFCNSNNNSATSHGNHSPQVCSRNTVSHHLYAEPLFVIHTFTLQHHVAPLTREQTRSTTIIFYAQL